MCQQLAAARLDARYDAVVVALRPAQHPVLSDIVAQALADQAPGTIVAQYWGEVDREALIAAGVPVWPAVAPAPGHMGILPSAVGPEPIVRLQAAGLKVGEVLCKDPKHLTRADLDYVEWV